MAGDFGVRDFLGLADFFPDDHFGGQTRARDGGAAPKCLKLRVLDGTVGFVNFDAHFDHIAAARLADNRLPDRLLFLV